MALGKNCGTCSEAEETDSHVTVTCTCKCSPNYEKEMLTTSWCKYYEEA